MNDLGGNADGTGGGSSMADATVKEINEAGGKAVANYDSVATPEGGEAIIKTALDNFGKVDIVINNAGILRDKTLRRSSSREDLEAVLDVHLKGAFFVTQPAFRVDEGERLRPHRLHVVGRRHLRQLRPDQLRRGEDGPRRPVERARASRARRTTSSAT